MERQNIEEPERRNQPEEVMKKKSKRKIRTGGKEPRTEQRVIQSKEGLRRKKVKSLCNVPDKIFISMHISV